MNLFVLDTNPLTAATALNDKHVLKMILETAQLLDGGTRPIMQAIQPNQTHEIVGIPASQKNNPCILSASSEIVWDYAHRHFIGLLGEYRYRYGKRHSYDTEDMRRKLTERGNSARNGMSGAGFYLAMPDAHKGRDKRGLASLAQAVVSYRSYYSREKTSFGTVPKPATWKRRAPPVWLTRTMNDLDYQRNLSSDGHYHFYQKKVTA